MHAAATPRQEGKGTILFVRPASACDTSDHARVVDEEGRFVATLAPATSFVAVVEPGRHVYYVWPGMDVRDIHPNGQAVDVISVNAPADETKYVGVRTAQFEKLKCPKYAVFRFAKPSKAQAEEWLAEAQELVPDPDEGKALLDHDGEATRGYLEMARAKRDAAKEPPPPPQPEPAPPALP